MKMKEESERAGLKLSIQRTQIMASGPITSWQIDGGKMETMTDYFLGFLRESIPRQVERKSGVPEKETGV